jgi:hypothetical protein
VRAGHAGGGLAEPALILRHFANPLEVNGGSPMARADLSHGAGKGVPHFIQTGLLWRERQYLFRSMMSWGLVPFLFFEPELLRDPVSDRHNL